MFLAIRSKMKDEYQLSQQNPGTSDEVVLKNSIDLQPCIGIYYVGKYIIIIITNEFKIGLERMKKTIQANPIQTFFIHLNPNLTGLFLENRLPPLPPKNKNP